MNGCHHMPDIRKSQVSSLHLGSVKEAETGTNRRRPFKNFVRNFAVEVCYWFLDNVKVIFAVTSTMMALPPQQ